MKKRVLTAGALLAALLLYLAQTATSPSQQQSGVRAVDDAASRGVPVEPWTGELEQGISSGAEHSTLDPLIDEGLADERSSAAKSRPGVAWSVAGTIVITDSDGVLHADLSGTLVFELKRKGGRERERRSVNVTQGKWSLEPAPPSLLFPAMVNQPSDGGAPASLELMSLRMAGRKTLTDRYRTFTCSQGPIALRGSWPEHMLLQVRDARSGAQLSQVELRLGDAVVGFPSHSPRSGAYDEEFLSGQHSPIAIELPDRLFGSRRLLIYAHSPGYAWGSVRIEPSRGGEYSIDLRPGGDVNIIARTRHGQIPPDVFPLLRIYAQDGESVGPTVNKGIAVPSKTQIKGLPEGEFRVAIELGDWRGKPHTLAEATVHVSAGNAQTIDLALDPLGDNAEVPFSGLLTLPPEWRLQTFQLVVSLRGPSAHGRDLSWLLSEFNTKPVAGQPGVFAWEINGAPAGRYEFEFATIGYKAAFDVGRQGRRDIHIVTPLPSMLTVEVITQDTGASIPVNYLAWMCEREGDIQYEGMQRFEQYPENGLYVIRVPRTTVRLRALLSNYLIPDETVDVTSSAVGVQLIATRVYRVRIRMHDGPRPLSSIPGWGLESFKLDGPGKLLSVSQKSNGYMLSLDRPGLYQIGFPDIAGFKPIPSATVDVVQEPVISHRIQLESD